MLVIKYTKSVWNSPILTLFSFLYNPVVTIYAMYPSAPPITSLTGFTMVFIFYVLMVRLMYLDKVSIREKNKSGTQSVMTVEVNSKKGAASNDRPGRLSILVAGFLQSPEEREFMIGCLEERYRKDFKKHGMFYATTMIWRDNLVAFWSSGGNSVLRVIRWTGSLMITGKAITYLIEKFFK